MVTSLPGERVLLVPLHLAARRLEALVRETQAGDPLAPVTVVGPSNYADLSLRHALGRQGIANVRFIVLPRLAELLGAPALGERGMRPLTPTLESAAVGAVAEQAGGPLEGLRSHPSLHQSLHATFRDLRRSETGAIDRAGEDGGRRGGALHAEVIRLYRRFLHLTESFYDREALAWSAAETVERGRSPGLRDLGAVVLYLPDDLSPAERSLARALLGRPGGRAVLGLSGDALVDEGTLELAAALESRHEKPASSASAGTTPGSTHILIAPDPQEETRWVLRHVMKQAEAGVPFHRMALLYRQSRPYARLLREQCALAGIPVAGPAVTPLAETAVGRTLAGLLALAAGDLDRDEVMAWLAGCPVVARRAERGDEGVLVHPSEWDAISRKSGVVRGREQWRERLERYALEQERRSEDAERQEQRSEAALERMRREAAQARELAGFVDALAEDLKPPLAGTGWRPFVDWAQGLLRRYVAGEGMPGAEAGAWERVTRALEELAGIEGVGPAATFDGFRGAVEELLAAASGHTGRTGEGLFIASFSLARGMEFDRAYLVGMVEGAVPPKAPDDPLLPDSIRRRASGAGPGIPLRASRARQERRDYLAALFSAPHRVLSFPKGDPVAERGQFPSRWLLEQASALEGERVFTTTLERLGHRPWLTRLASREEALRAMQGPMGEGAPADLHDRDLASLLIWRSEGRWLHEHHLSAGDSHLSAALAMLRASASVQLTPWDGNVSEVAADSRRLRAAGRQIMSPSRLQTWAKCPFEYFLSAVLGIGGLETPEETDVITPLDRGTLIHGVLERFLREVIDAGPPAPDQPWSAIHRARLRELAHEAFEDAEARGLTGRRLLWELEREDILDDLEEFLKQDTALRRELRTTPWRVEHRFGFGPEGPEVQAFLGPEAGPLAFRGVIDRIDRTPDGGALVLDYKTGRDSVYQGLEKDPVDRGRLLQLPVYGLAARGLVGAGVPVRAAYWFVTVRGGFSRRPREPLALEATWGRFEEAVGIIAGGVGQGYFPANPGPDKDNCRWCDFDRVCPSRRIGAWERKRRNPGLAAYVRLAEGASSEDLDGEAEEEAS